MGYHVTVLQAETYVAKQQDSALQVKHYPDRHGEAAPDEIYGVWHKINCHWVFVS